MLPIAHELCRQWPTAEPSRARARARAEPEPELLPVARSTHIMLFTAQSAARVQAVARAESVRAVARAVVRAVRAAYSCRSIGPSDRMANIGPS